MIDFGRQGNGREFLRSGWSQPETDETWAIDGTSSLAIPTPEKPATYILILKLRPHIVPALLLSQRLQIFVNDSEIAQFTLTQPASRACRIPWNAIAGHQIMDIRFEMPDRARPAELGGMGDERALGVAFSELRMFADWASAPEEPQRQPTQTPVGIDTISEADRLPVSELMLKFESLGQNCEFGLVQRKCGAEPLGLFRFSSTPLPKLISAMEAEFEGLGRPEEVQVQVSPNGREFMINDSRFGFLYHAFVDNGSMSVEALHRREILRLPLLIRKLLEDLRAAEKIFVFKAMGPMPPEHAFPLAASLRRYGPNTLLFVTLADSANAAGSVRVIAPGFIVGYASRFAPSEDAADFDLAQWVHICRGAYRLRLAGVDK